MKVNRDGKATSVGANYRAACRFRQPILETIALWLIMCEGRRKTAPLALPNVCASCRLTAPKLLASLLSYLLRSVGSLRQLAKVVEFGVC